MVEEDSEDERNNVNEWFTQKGDAFICAKCGQSFKNMAAVLTHYAHHRVHACSVHVEDRAVQTTLEMIKSNKIFLNHKPIENPVLTAINILMK